MVAQSEDQCRSRSDAECRKTSPKRRSSLIDLLDVHAKDTRDESERQVHSGEQSQKRGALGLLLHGRRVLDVDGSHDKVDLVVELLADPVQLVHEM